MHLTNPLQRESKRRAQLTALGVYTFTRQCVMVLMLLLQVEVDYVGYKEQFPAKGQHVRCDVPRDAAAPPPLTPCSPGLISDCHVKCNKQHSSVPAIHLVFQVSQVP